MRPSQTPEGRARLRDQGVVDAGGNVAPDLHRVLELLSRPSGSTTVGVTGAAGSLAHVSYGDGSAPTIGVTATMNGTIRLQAPGPEAEIAEILGRVLGSGADSGVDPLDLGLSEASVLAAIIDATRRHWFAQLAGGGDIEPVRRQELSELLARPAEGSFWIVDAVAKATATEPEHASADLDTALGRLVAGRVADTSAGVVALAGRWAELPARFLTPGSVIELENLRIAAEPGPVSRAGLVTLRGAGDELLSLERVGDRVRVEAIGAAVLNRYVAALLRAPSGEAPIRFVMTHLVLPGGPAPTWRMPNTDSPQLAGVASGTGLRLLSETGGWAEVESAAGWQGWLDRRWLGDPPVTG